MKPAKKLRIGNFQVKDIVFGDKTSFKNGVLTVNKNEAIAAVDPKKELTNIQIHIVHPGDSTRIIPCKNAVEPRYRPDGRSTFPGLIGPVECCGYGDLYAMKGISVIACGKYGQSSDGMLDMSGPGAEHSFFAQMVNLVVYAELIHPTGVDQPFRNETPLKMAAHYLADYVARTLEGMEPEEWLSYDWEAGAAEAEKKGLPRVVYISQMRGQVGRDKFFNDTIFGIDVEDMLPVVMHPNAVFDGQIASFGGFYGDGFYTYAYQNQPIIKRLYEEHGKTINFVGMIFWPCDSADKVKQTCKVMSGELCYMLKAEAAIVHSTAGGSNYDIDFFYHIAELEDHGVKVVGMTGEHSGKSMLDPKGDAIVTGGDSGEIFEFPPMDLVIGDLNSVVRDFYHAAWTEHDKYGPSLRPDGSLIVNGCMVADSTNNCAFTTKTVKDF